MRAKFINENYPMGARNDIRAPWNEEDTEYTTSIIDNTLVLTSDDEKLYVDSYYLDEKIAEKLNLDINNEESFDLKGVYDKNGYVDLETDKGAVQFSYDELLNLT